MVRFPRSDPFDVVDPQGDPFDAVFRRFFQKFNFHRDGRCRITLAIGSAIGSDIELLFPVKLLSIPSPLRIAVGSAGADIPPPFISPFSELVSLRNDVASVVGEYVILVGLVVCDCHSVDDGNELFSDELRLAGLDC